MKIVLSLLLALSTSVTLAEERSTDGQAGQTGVVEQSDQSQGYVRRALFTSNVRDHEPVDKLLSLSNSETAVYFYTELRQLQGQTVTHRWTYNDEVLAEVRFDVGGQRWRVWSKKTLLPFWIGDIHVSVIDGNGNELTSAVLQYTDTGQ